MEVVQALESFGPHPKVGSSLDEFFPIGERRSVTSRIFINAIFSTRLQPPRLLGYFHSLILYFFNFGVSKKVVRRKVLIKK